MAHKLTRYSHDGKTAKLIDYVIVDQRLTGSIQHTKVISCSGIDVKSINHHLVVSRANLKLKFQIYTYLLKSYGVGRIKGKNLRKKLSRSI